MFLDQKNQYYETVFTTQGNLQIQCNPFQTTNGIFFFFFFFFAELEKKYKIHMETQKTQNSQSNIEKEKQSWRNQAP